MAAATIDTIARTLATRASRRSAIRRLSGGGLAALVAGRAGWTPKAVKADHCNYIGCGCSTGTRHPCGRGLTCCPLNPGLPGGAGVCSDPADCGGACVGDGGSCGSSCNWGDACPICCSGYCGTVGVCDEVSCTGPGCACATGTFNPCSNGLVCCSSYPGLAGAQGTCQYSC